MQQEVNHNEWMITLARTYENDPGQFVTLPRLFIDSSSNRFIVSELRNEGLLEEQVRGVVRFTKRGYQAYKG